MSAPKQYIVLREVEGDAMRFVRDVWWSGLHVDLIEVIERIDPTLFVYTVASTDILFPNVGSFRRERNQR